MPLDAVRIGHLDGDLYDPRCTWLRHRGIASDGAILVRPDRFIAWRHPSAVDHPRAAANALSQILARPIGAPVARPPDPGADRREGLTITLVFAPAASGLSPRYPRALK